MKKLMIGCLAVAIITALLGCGTGTAAKVSAQDVKIQMNGKNVVVHAISSTDVLQAVNVRHALADKSGNKYALDSDNRLVYYQKSENSKAQTFRLQSVKSDQELERSVKTLFASANIPHLKDFKVDNSANYAEFNMKELTRRVGEGEKDSMTVKYDASGDVQSASITYFTENDERIPGNKKAALDKKAQAYIDNQLAQQKKVKPNEDITAQIAAKKYTLRGATITGGYSIIFKSAAKGQPDAAVKWGDAQAFTVFK